MPTTICRHIKTNGLRCGSPALTGEIFCYFHKGLHIRHRPKPAADIVPITLHPTRTDDRGGQLNPLIAEYFTPQPEALDLPPLEDRESIQVAISTLVTALAANRINPKRASTLLYGLQVASSNCNRLDLRPSHTDIVRETVLDSNGEQIAPDEDPQSEIDFQSFLQSLEDDHDDEADEDDEDDEDDDGHDETWR